MSNQTNKQLAALLRQLADEIERGNTTSFDSLAPVVSAIVYDRRQLIRPTPTPQKLTPPTPPTIVYENGQARPMNIRRRVELADTTEHKWISWPHNWQQLAKFARLPEVKREFWSGKARIYGDALKLFARYGFIERRGNGWQWARDFTPLQRREFAGQFRPSVPTSPAQK